MSRWARDGRPLLVDVGATGSTVRVVLDVRGRRHAGTASAEPGSEPAALVDAGARATLDALDQATPAAVELQLEWSEILFLDEALPPLAVVLTTVTVADVPLRTPGAVLLRDEPAWAGARAVLQGLNRRLEVLGL